MGSTRHERDCRAGGQPKPEVAAGAGLVRCRPSVLGRLLLRACIVRRSRAILGAQVSRQEARGTPQQARLGEGPFSWPSLFARRALATTCSIIYHPRPAVLDRSGRCWLN